MLGSLYNEIFASSNNCYLQKNTNRKGKFFSELDFDDNNSNADTSLTLSDNAILRLFRYGFQYFLTILLFLLYDLSKLFLHSLMNRRKKIAI